MSPTAWKLASCWIIAAAISGWIQLFMGTTPDRQDVVWLLAATYYTFRCVHEGQLWPEKNLTEP